MYHSTFIFIKIFKMKWLSLNFYYTIWGERVDYNMVVPRYIVLTLLIWTIVCWWKIFEKAWLPGRWALVPFYNIFLRFKISSMSGWRVCSLLFPPLFIIVFIVSLFKLAKNFGKSGGFGLWLWFLNPIFLWLLAFDKSKYQAK